MMAASESVTLVPPTSDTAAPAVSTMVVSLAETIGLIPASSSGGGVEHKQVLAAFAAFAREGVGGAASATVHAAFTPETVAHAGSQLLEAAQHSPMPDREWESMSAVLGEDLLAALVGVSEVSLRRYRARQRSTPDQVAARLHHITLLVAYLAGSYNTFGIRRWFHRSRTTLNRRSPAQVLSKDWDPDDPDVSAVTSLAAALLYPTAA